MITRYEVPEVSSLWSDQTKYETFLEVELAIMQAWEELGDFVKPGTTQTLRECAKVNCARVDEIEKVTRHDVIAFCTMISEQVPVDVGRWFHFGVTSSDIIDTAMSLQLKRSLVHVKESLNDVRIQLSLRAKEHKELATLGRSHGGRAYEFWSKTIRSLL